MTDTPVASRRSGSARRRSGPYTCWRCGRHAATTGPCGHCGHSIVLLNRFRWYRRLRRQLAKQAAKR